MKIINQSMYLHNNLISYEEMLRIIEEAARNCYQSKIKGNSEDFIRNLIKKGHESPLEQISITFKIITDRAVLAELSRHRHISLMVESQRFVKYEDITFIKPVWLDDEAEQIFIDSCISSENFYKNLIKKGKTPQQARIVLTNTTKCIIICTANLREWRYIFKLRTTKENNPQFRMLLFQGLKEVKEKYPVFFEDIIIL